MIVEFDKSFLKSIEKVKDVTLSSKIEKLIIEYENAQTLSEVKNTKKLTGYKAYYRIRIGDYKLGFELMGSNTIRLLIIAHRRDIYCTFP